MEAFEVVVGERVKRRAFAHVPESGDVLPIVVALHGGTKTPEQHADMTGLCRLADETHAFAVILPEGSDRWTGSTVERLVPESRRARSWNAGHGALGWPAENDVDDLAFVAQAISAARKRFEGLSSGRVGITGISVGSMLACELAYRRPDLVAAVAMCAGEFPEVPPLAAMRTAVPVVWSRITHGTKDRHVPLNGGTGPAALDPYSYPPTADAVRWWKGRSGGDRCETRIEAFGHWWPTGETTEVARFFQAAGVLSRDVAF